ncbi:YjeF N-terminal domain-containing protein [Dipodascopsis tothii]|uniref:YjeF N-terminal domain-containing protein n=1 Tax=Dipodascopsis tothii TaxID=44089 RepID=UPI0034CD4B88
MAARFLSARSAALLDQELMSTGAFSIDQLMELAGLSCAQAVFRVHPPAERPRVLVIAGPGNNGGDGLVAARHLKLFGYAPSVYYPKRPRSELYTRLVAQLENLAVPFVADVDAAVADADQIVDAIFGFSFKPPIREPFPHVIALLAAAGKPVISVDIPSSWDVDAGPPDGCTFMPAALVSLTAPKPASAHFRGRHFVGGRFVDRALAAKWGFALPDYVGTDQVVELTE